MNLKELKERGGFVSSALVKKEIVWKHAAESGEEHTDTFTVFVRRQSFGSVERVFFGQADQSKAATLISESLRLGDGKERLSYEDAFQLDPSLAALFIAAINEVNGVGEQKNSPPPTNSGTN